MHILKPLALVVAVIIAMSCLSSPAAAQATRTWVSGVGDDVNPCSRTAPCKTFAGAISKTIANGEINCLDPGGFGAVTITKAIAIVCDATEAGVLSGGDGIVVNLSNREDNVLLSGLDIFGGSAEGSGLRIAGSGVIHIRNSTISGFRGGAGVSFAPSGNSTLIITGSTISGNQTGIAASGSGAGKVIVGDSLIIANGNGLSASDGATLVSIGNNVLARNGSDGHFSATLARQ